MSSWSLSFPLHGSLWESPFPSSLSMWFLAASPLEEEKFGFLAFSGISRLTWLVCLFGELSLISATLEDRKEDQYLKMTVQLETQNKGWVVRSPKRLLMSSGSLRVTLPWHPDPRQVSAPVERESSHLVYVVFPSFTPSEVWRNNGSPVAIKQIMAYRNKASKSYASN